MLRPRSRGANGSGELGSEGTPSAIAAPPTTGPSAVAVHRLGAVSLALGDVTRARGLMRAAAGGSTPSGGAWQAGPRSCTAVSRSRRERPAIATRDGPPAHRARLLSYPEAYCALRDGDYEDVADTSALGPIAEAPRDGRHRGLGARWPELAAFLERHRLVPMPA